ncbi:MAG: hypothetical protein QOE77_506 [Blastocatellia bacterium]|jgi:hypothetical protein|nr:hypothetical protein [Blastocatellia bacterium]
MGLRYSPNNKILRRILYSLVLSCVIYAGPSFGQQPAPPQLDAAALNEFISLASRRASEYTAKFTDITADEDQKIEEYDDKGKLKRQRQIVSKLIVYQSQLDPTVTAEYRYVHAVDGVPLAKREERMVKFYDRLAKSDSVKKELERINRESQRYDLVHSFYGLTVNQGLPLSEKARAAFRFTVAGREQINGRDVIVLQYQQIAQSPELTFKLGSLPSPLKGAEAFYRGRLWLDAETAQLWREVREVTLQLSRLGYPLVIMRQEFEYVSSSFGILTPRRIVAITNSNGRTLAGNVPELMLGGKITFEYSGFHRFEVSAPEATVQPPAKP